jgi:hypothetical protein
MWRSFHKLNFCCLLRLEPLHLCHHFFGNGVLVLWFSFWQVHKGHLLGFEVLHGAEYLGAVELVESCNQTLHVV